MKIIIASAQLYFLLATCWVSEQIPKISHYINAEFAILRKHIALLKCGRHIDAANQEAQAH